jgi:hypothetical protein
MDCHSKNKIYICENFGKPRIVRAYNIVESCL